MENREIGGIVNQFEDVKMSRRKFLRNSASTVVAAVVLPGAVAGDVAHTIYRTESNMSFAEDLVNKKLAAQGQKPLDEIDVRKNQGGKGENAWWSSFLERDERIRQYSSMLDEDDRRQLREQMEANESRGLFSRDVFAGIGGLSAGIAHFKYLQSRGEYKNWRGKRREIYDRITERYPEWKNTPPSESELLDFKDKLITLPPMGGKIQKPGKGRLHIHFGGLVTPSYLAEGHADKVNSLREKGETGEQYVHQFGVQGKLPDRFKYAAIALILHSPHRRNWEETWINAPWGKVGPLIHDGGGTQIDFNGRWKGVEGRTDYFQSSFLEKPIDENQDALSYFDSLESKPDAAEFNRLEEARIRQEAKFYQRSAFALHSVLGSAPDSIPEEKREEAAAIWQGFESRMKQLLLSYGVEGAGDVTWLSEDSYRPRGLLGRLWGKRHEVEYEPVKRELIKLEDVKHKNPELRRAASELIASVTNRINEIVGI